MTQDCSLPSSTAQSDAAPRRSLQGIHIIGTDEKSASKVEGVSSCEEQAPPWGYLFMQHMVVEKFQKLISNNRIVGDFIPLFYSSHRQLQAQAKRQGRNEGREAHRQRISIFARHHRRAPHLFISKFPPIPFSS